MPDICHCRTFFDDGEVEECVEGDGLRFREWPTGSNLAVAYLGRGGLFSKCDFRKARTLRFDFAPYP